MKHKILVVDDKQTIVMAMEQYLRSMAYDVNTARDLEEAKSLIAREEYSLVLTDVQLTGAFGLEGLEIIRAARKKNPDIRVVILTAYSSSELEAEAQRLKVDVILHKPQPLREVVQLIHDLVNGEASSFVEEE